MKMLGITGYSGSGKTTLLEKLLPCLQMQGLRVAVIKHSHHNAEVDKEGKDSWRMKEAKASQVIMACDQRWVLMTDTSEPVTLDYLAKQFDPNLTDLILVEGFKHEPIPKILLHRQAMTKTFPDLDNNVIAVATDLPMNLSIPHLNINHTEKIAQFIYQWYKQPLNF